jgi:FKBP-type peptidyl-prolyl cis-trans isomerase
MQQRAVLFASILALASCSKSEPSDAEATPAEASAEVTAPAQAASPAQPETLDLGDGLTVEVLERGKGEPAKRGCELLVHFTSRVDGAEQPFDSSYSRGLPDRWRMSSSASPRLIEGLVRGLDGLPAGSRAVVHIPAALGYGTEGRPGAGIPADSALVYEVKLLEVRP